jgi:magnesium-transporting ATPase (P-type)
MQKDTRQLLRVGIVLLIIGGIAAALMFTVFGGVTHQGPHTNMGWIALVAALGCVPPGLLLLLLGLAKLAGGRAQ